MLHFNYRVLIVHITTKYVRNHRYHRPLASSAESPLAGVQGRFPPPADWRATSPSVRARVHLGPRQSPISRQRHSKTSIRTEALVNRTGRLSSSPSEWRSTRAKQKKGFIRARTDFVHSIAYIGFHNFAESQKSIVTATASTYTFITIERDSDEVFSRLSLSAPYQRGREREMSLARRRLREPNGMLNGIWEVLAARSHLYATPRVASPATVRSPQHWLYSLLSRCGCRWTRIRFDLYPRIFNNTHFHQHSLAL